MFNDVINEHLTHKPNAYHFKLSNMWNNIFISTLFIII
jgi:hypothetical protein